MSIMIGRKPKSESSKKTPKAKEVSSKGDASNAIKEKAPKRKTTKES